MKILRQINVPSRKSQFNPNRLTGRASQIYLNYVINITLQNTIHVTVFNCCSKTKKYQIQYFASSLQIYTLGHTEMKKKVK